MISRLPSLETIGSGIFIVGSFSILNGILGAIGNMIDTAAKQGHAINDTQVLVVGFAIGAGVGVGTCLLIPLTCAGIALSSRLILSCRSYQPIEQISDNESFDSIQEISSSLSEEESLSSEDTELSDQNDSYLGNCFSNCWSNLYRRKENIQLADDSDEESLLSLQL